MYFEFNYNINRENTFTHCLKPYLLIAPIELQNSELPNSEHYDKIITPNNKGDDSDVVKRESTNAVILWLKNFAVVTNYLEVEKS